MAVAYITASPYATQEGTLTIPDNLSEEEANKYVKDHWNDIQFNEPDLDYAGTDFELSVEEE